MRKDVLNPCPYCDTKATYSAFYDPREHMSKLKEGRLYHVLAYCDNEKCGRVILLIFKGVTMTTDRGYEYIDTELVDQYPKRTPKSHKSIPRQVADDYIEAIKCFDIDAWKATVAMCRRALQGSVIEKGAKKERLVDQIDELYDQQIITKDIKDWAHEIRLTGNIGAHPDKDGLENVTKEDAKELIDFMEEYLNYVYIMPSKVESKRAKKAKLEAPKKEQAPGK